jgi:hypothetical protein
MHFGRIASHVKLELAKPDSAALNVAAQHIDSPGFRYVGASKALEQLREVGLERYTANTISYFLDHPSFARLKNGFRDTVIGLMGNKLFVGPPGVIGVLVEVEEGLRIVSHSQESHCCQTRHCPEETSAR